jgi:hypothetical protein
MSALPCKADIDHNVWYVCFVPEANIATYSAASGSDQCAASVSVEIGSPAVIQPPKPREFENSLRTRRLRIGSHQADAAEQAGGVPRLVWSRSINQFLDFWKSFKHQFCFPCLRVTGGIQACHSAAVSTHELSSLFHDSR